MDDNNQKIIMITEEGLMFKITKEDAQDFVDSGFFKWSDDGLSIIYSFCDKEEED